MFDTLPPELIINIMSYNSDILYEQVKISELSKDMNKLCKNNPYILNYILRLTVEELCILKFYKI